MEKKEGKTTAPWPERKLSRTWKSLLILAVAVLVVATVFFWYQGGWENIDQLTNNYAVFAIFSALVAVSFFVQYRYGAPERRRREISRRVPIVFVFGVGVVVFAAVLQWLKNLCASPRSIISGVVHAPAVLGSALGLILGGIALSFVLLPKGDQRRATNVFLIILAASLTFGGPTYLLYVAQRLPISYPLLVLLGLAAFVVGAFLLLRLLEKESKIEFSR